MAGAIALIVLECYSERVSSGVWRVCFGLGFVVPIALFFFRIRMVESTQYRKHAIKQNVPYLLIIKRYWKVRSSGIESEVYRDTNIQQPMVGTSLAWFFYDL